MAERRERGALESVVLRELWRADRALSARDIIDRLDAETHVPALTTVLTVLDRLRAKGRVLKSESPGGGALFEPAESESSSAASAMLAALVNSSDRNAALLRFAGDLDQRDLATLRTALGNDDSVAVSGAVSVGDGAVPVSTAAVPVRD